MIPNNEEEKVTKGLQAVPAIVLPVPLRAGHLFPARSRILGLGGHRR